MTGAPDTIHQRGRAALLAGREVLDVPPAPGASRWGLSLVVRPDPAAEDRLNALTGQAAALAGPGQWSTGSCGSAHLTVTYLEATHRKIEADDPAVRRFAEVVSGVAARTPPLRWQLPGLALADRGVLALAAPVGDAADTFRSAVLAELGDLGRREASYRRGTWWSTLVHFAAPVADRAGLADWVEARVSTSLGQLTAPAADIVRYEHAQDRVVPVTLFSAPLTGVPGEA